MSATNVQAELAWSIQIRKKTLYREEEQDNSATEPFGDTDFEVIQRHILRQRRLFAPESRDIRRSVQLLSFFRYIMQYLLIAFHLFITVTLSKQGRMSITCIFTQIHMMAKRVII